VSPSGPAAEFDRARVLAGLGRAAEAVPLLDAILRQDPAHEGALLLRATLHGEERDWEKALDLNQRAARFWPRSAEAVNALARCLHAMGRDQEALKTAHEARAVLGEGNNFAQTAAVYLTLVWCLREMRRFREAVAVAEEGLARMPDAVLAQWATQIEEELVIAERDRC
jgi:tetratricopeptide (TPR) repeat protein